MKYITFCLTLLVVATSATTLHAATPASGPTRGPTTLPARENFHLYLLVGQSNMAGRGKVESQDKTPHPRVLMLNKNQEWVAAVEPVHFDKSVAGVGPALAFGKAMAEANSNVTIGLIPAAMGGSSIGQWGAGQKFYQTAIDRVHRAAKDGVIKGVLWHQGESDLAPQPTRVYLEKLVDLVGRFRKDLNEPRLPFLAGELGEFLTTDPKEFNKALAGLPDKAAHTAVVSASGLKDRGDHLHFDSESARELGRRYAAAMLKLEGLAIAIVTLSEEAGERAGVGR